MYKVIARLVKKLNFTQKKNVSRYPISNNYEMVLYNEHPRKSKAVVLGFNDNKNNEFQQSGDINRVRSSNSKILFLFNSSLVVLYNDPYVKPIPFENTDRNKKERPVEAKIPTIEIKDLLKWFAKAKGTDGKDVKQSGGRIGRLDAANEAGFFHRTNRSRLKEIKKKLQNKGKDEPVVPKKTS